MNNQRCTILISQLKPLARQALTVRFGVCALAMFRACLALGLIVVLAACAPMVTKHAPAVIEPASASPTPTPEPPPAPPVVRKYSFAKDIQILLREANMAVDADRLTSPIHDNAFDRFQAVLILQPDNLEAKLGLEQIVLRYLNLAKAAAAHSEYGKARTLLERARQVGPNDIRVDELGAKLSQARSVQQLPSSSPVSEDEILFDLEQLDQQSDLVVAQLHNVAQQARQQGDTLLIIARSDQEGRWMYKHMKQAVPGYRLRGDIKLGTVPKIMLLPPID